MAKTLAELLAGEDMEGGENFCDSIYNFLKNQGKDLNLFTNSGFGVWSQSDANKGLAALVFDNGTVAPVVGEVIAGASATGKIIWVDVTNDDWAGGNGAGTAYLGAVTGAYIDNEFIAGGDAAVFQVAGDLNIGVKNDPMNDNSVVSWSDDGANIWLADNVGEYIVTTDLANQRAWLANAPLEAGKIYKIELDIRNGSVADRHVELYFDDGVAQYGKIEATVVGWTSIFFVFECATTTATGEVGFRVVENMGGGGNNFEIRQFSCYEITPCCTNNADNLAFDGWHKDETVDIYRQHWDATYSKCGSFYSLKIVPSHADDYVVFPLFPEISDKEFWYKQFCGETVTIGAWVLTNTASHAHVYIGDNVSGAQYSGYHTGGGAWEWLELTFTIDAAATRVLFGFYCTVAGDVDGSTIVYVSQPMLVLSTSIGEGQYQPRLQEEILLEKAILSNSLDALTSQDDIPVANLNIESDSSAMLPKGCKAVKILTQCNDVNSHNTDCYLRFRANAVKDYEYYNSPYGLTTDADKRFLGWQQCDADGDIDYNLESSAAGNFDIDICKYVAVRVN